MSDTEASVMIAARKLSNELALPSGIASIFAWYEGGNEVILIAGDSKWLSNHACLPNEYMGFTVKVRDSFDISAQRRLH